MGKAKRTKTVSQVSVAPALTKGLRAKTVPVAPALTKGLRAKTVPVGPALTKGRARKSSASQSAAPTDDNQFAQILALQQEMMGKITAIDARVGRIETPAAAGSAETLPVVDASAGEPSAEIQSASKVVEPRAQVLAEPQAEDGSVAVEKELGSSFVLARHELPGTLISPFISVTHDIDGHVPISLKKKIQLSQYIDIAYLLEGSIKTAETDTYSLNLSMGESQNGSLTLKAPGPKRQITNVAQWTDAFLVFSSIYLKIHSQRERELLAYMRIIRRAASYGSTGYKLYDEQFRHVQQSNPSRSWASIDSELYLVYVLGPKGGQAMPFRAAAGQASNTSESNQSNRQGVCFKFNGPAGCPYPAGKCRFNHACRKCDSRSHPQQECTSK